MVLIVTPLLYFLNKYFIFRKYAIQSHPLMCSDLEQIIEISSWFYPLQISQFCNILLEPNLTFTMYIYTHTYMRLYRSK